MISSTVNVIQQWLAALRQMTSNDKIDLALLPLVESSSVILDHASTELPSAHLFKTLALSLLWQKRIIIMHVIIFVMTSGLITVETSKNVCPKRVRQTSKTLTDNLTLVLVVQLFYAHLMRLVVKSPHCSRLLRKTSICFFKLQTRQNRPWRFYRQWFRRRRITGNIAAQTGSTYISESMTDIIKIPTANLRFSITASSKSVPERFQ